MSINIYQIALEEFQEESSVATVIRRPPERWSKAAIASLSALHISRMDDRSLIEIVEQVQQFLPQTILRRRLQLCDRVTLERLVYLARRICRNQGY